MGGKGVTRPRTSPTSEQICQTHFTFQLACHGVLYFMYLMLCIFPSTCKPYSVCRQDLRNMVSWFTAASCARLSSPQGTATRQVYGCLRLVVLVSSEPQVRPISDSSHLLWRGARTYMHVSKSLTLAGLEGEHSFFHLTRWDPAGVSACTELSCCPWRLGGVERREQAVLPMRGGNRGHEE